MLQLTNDKEISISKWNSVYYYQLHLNDSKFTRKERVIIKAQNDQEFDYTIKKNTDRLKSNKRIN